MAESSDLLVAWTTVQSEADALSLGRAIVDFKLAVCVQIDGPVRSVYLWEGKMCEEMEWRLLVKFLATRQADLERYLDEKHPYETHEWMVMKPGHVAPKYLAWAQDGESDSK